MENNIKLSGKNAFDIFLNMISDFNMLFIKQDYYNTGDYNYFFTSEKITKTKEIIDTLSRKKSLETAYKTLGNIQNMRLSFFFGVKNSVLFYGYYNEDNRYVYKVGKFKVTPKDLRNISKKKSMKTIRLILQNNNLKNMKLLQEIKVDFHTLFDTDENDVEILDEYRIKNSFSSDFLREEDLDENKLRIFLLQWSRNFKWSDKCHYYIHLTDKYVHFYIKIKTQII